MNGNNYDITSSTLLTIQGVRISFLRIKIISILSTVWHSSVHQFSRIESTSCDTKKTKKKYRIDDWFLYFYRLSSE